MREQTTDQQMMAQQGQIRRRPQRSADAILARAAAQRRSNRYVFAPDHLHGAWTLSEMATALSTAWLAGAVWVERLVSPRGETLGYSCARFEDDFLTIEHIFEPDNQTACERWLNARLLTARSVVWLELGSQRSLMTNPQIIRYNLTPEEFAEQERERLHVTRDIEWVAAEVVLAEEVLAQSRTNMLSLIGLCAADAMAQGGEERAA
jgi:hypothetical protein